MQKSPPVANINDLVKYQSDSVVSKTLIKGEKGSVTLFAFDKGQGLSEHTAPFDALVHVIEGEADVTVAQKSHVVQTGQMIILPANKPHALQAVVPFKMVLVMVRE
ncbi:MAG: cupin domain-containing protein [Candidatus Marinimicrobia bacterium]|jgi:quercetin dioxygenase-like cupin family protein|nr:cupin domain-containing protein [Candidatus Neomarinimicrobiota bacterium]MDP6593574.1 cupin domain-containing protein [Candidatus Neomarinimicrobiota bacterium]MDP6836275.1 cupin domain-containing protein [Candidatus Neomarinimicrobiota bacterium]|tara:strand:+ start:19 stop:336 length:318 start_codon:yes stop_codon:yes gene_type:complete